MMLEELLRNGASALGLELDAEQEGQFRQYYELLTEKSRVMNLTTISGEEDAAKLHFLDSIALLREFDFKDKYMIDVGTGAGFPGLPLKIAEKTIGVVLMDSTEKKINFLWEVCEKLGLDADCVHGRAEEMAADPDFRESFDVCVSRAVARLNVLSELCLPFVKVGGAFLSMKAADSGEEINEAKGAIRALGGKIEKVAEYPIPGTDITRKAVIVRKVAKTPEKYPRRFAKIQKSPLK